MSLVSCDDFMEPNTDSPQLTLSEASAVTRSEATLSVTSSNISDYKLTLRLSTNRQMADSKEYDLTDPTSGNTFVVNLTDLNNATVYYYQASATAGYNEVTSDVYSFTTASIGQPIFTLPVSSNVTEGGFTVSATTTDKGGQEVYDFGFYLLEVADNATATQDQLLKGTRYTLDLNDELINPDHNSTITYTFNNLVPGQRYATLAYGISGGRGMSDIIYVTTIATETALPADCQITDSISKLASFVKLSSRIISSGSAPVTECGFVYSLEQHEPTVDNATIAVGELKSDNTFSVLLNDLKQGEKYYFRSYAKNDAGISYSENVTEHDVIETSWDPNIDVPVLVSRTANSLTINVKLIDDENDGLMVTQGFCCLPASSNTTPRYSDNTALAEYIHVDGNSTFTGTLVGLEPDTEYIVRAFVVTIAGNYGYSSDVIRVYTEKQAPNPFDVEFPGME